MMFLAGFSILFKCEVFMNFCKKATLLCIGYTITMIFGTVMLQNFLSKSGNIMIVFGLSSILYRFRKNCPSSFLRIQDFPDDRHGIAVADVFRLKIDHRGAVVGHLR